jgi:phosphatidate phosphatase APP1
MNGLSQLFSEKEKKRSNVIFHLATPHINIWHVLLFDNFFTQLTTPNSAIMFVHHSSVMMPHQKNIQSPGKSHHCQFSAAFHHKVSFHSRGQLV